MENIINKETHVINKLDLSAPVYKYIPLEYVRKMLKEKKLYVGKVAKWEDPYENFFLKQNFKYDSCSVITSVYRNKIYGQSWTLQSESDAMWRIYSEYSIKEKEEIDKKEEIDNTAIRVKTTAQKLFDTVWTSDTCFVTTYIGRVGYVEKEDMNKWLRELSNLGLSFLDIGDYIIQSLYIKRNPFSHEDEVRVIIDAEKDQGDFLIYDIDPTTMFDDFVLDPRLKKEEVDKITNELVGYGIDGGKIRKSDLYDFERVTIILQ